MVTSFCQALLLALDIIEFNHPSGVVVTTSTIPKFYSNGLDLDHARGTEGFWSDSLFKLFKRFLTYVIFLMRPRLFVGSGHVTDFLIVIQCRLLRS